MCTRPTIQHGFVRPGALKPHTSYFKAAYQDLLRTEASLLTDGVITRGAKAAAALKSRE